MDVLTPWLAATIEGELGEALRCWEDVTDKHQSKRKSQELSYDDGSNLRIPSTKQGPVVQITKFLTFEDPIQVTLSDSVIRVNASITSQASQRYAEKERKKVTQGTLGGLIQLQEFEIVATHFGPRDRRLTLYVKGFKSLGSNGSGEFGVAPQAIESREGTKELLNKLAGLRRQKSNAHSEQSATASPIWSQSSTQTSEAGNDQDSQSGFATQVPRSVAPILSKPKSRGPTTNINISTTSSTMSTTSLVPPPKAKHRDPLASTVGPQAHAARQRPSVNNTKALLSLLQNPKSASMQTGVTPEPTTDRLLRRNTASSDNKVTERENGPSRVSTSTSGNDDATSGYVESKKRKRRSLDDASRKKAADKHNSHEIDKARERSAVSHDLENSTQAGLALPAVSEDIVASQSTTPILAPAKLDPKAPLESSVYSIPKPNGSVSAQKIDRIRISNRDVTIPKDQEALLSRTDSWLPAEPGQREPTANIPISLLKRLNRKAEVRIQQSTRKQMSVRRTPSPAIDPATDSETDRPVSSGQWPASPDRDQLPPDSSFEAAEHSDHSALMILDQPCSLNSAETQSCAPMSSRSTPSRKSSLISAKQVAAQLGSPLIASSRISSPSGISITTDECTYPFTCQMPDCAKSYKRSGGLKNHMDCDHQSRRDDEMVRLSTTKPNSGKSSPPDAPPALMKPVTDLAEAYVSREKLSPLLSASSDPESDLEMTVPFALHEIKASIADSPPVQKPPSTASEPQDPFTQVKRTPYVNGRLQDSPRQKTEASSSPSKPKCNPSMNGSTNDDTEYVSASVASGPETSTVEDHNEEGSTHTFHNQSIEKTAARFTQENKSQEVTDSIAEKPDQLIAGVQQERRRMVSVVDETFDPPLNMNENQCPSPGPKSSVLITEINVSGPAVPEEVSTEKGNYEDHPSQIPNSVYHVQHAHEMKRKSGDLSFVSPSAAKRQKRFKPPLAFAFVERSEYPRDPAEGARQYRQDFLASRRSSESSTPTMSPTVPLSVFPKMTPESLLDPSERARQFRQEFLASRRSSENSTPTISPSKPFTALTGIFQAEYRDAEVGKKAKVAKSQNQSADADAQNHKTTDQKSLSPESETSKIDLNAAPLLNDIAEIESDAGDAELGAQGNPSCDYDIDSASFAREDARYIDVEGRDADQHTVIEASSPASNNEEQRTQSVELDVPVRSPDYRETEDRVANAEGGANQIIEPEEGMEVALHDQLATRDKNDRSVDSDLNNSIEQADDVAESERSAPAQKSVSNNVAEPHTVALKFLMQQHAIETFDTLISSQRASEPTPRQKSVPADADTPLPDELAKQIPSNQQRLGEYTNSQIPDLQVFQETVSLKHIACTDEYTNQTRPLSQAIPALNANTDTDKQSHLSPTALGPANPLSYPMSDPEVKPVKVHETLTPLSSETTETKTLSACDSLFDKFRVAYPAYPGDLKHFTAICRNISQLAQANRMEHQSLWDDFIVRHKVEYSQYLRRCAEEAEDAVPFEVFYRTEIEGPQHLKRVINRRNIDEALALIVEQPNSESIHSESIKDDERRAKPVDKSTSESGLDIEGMGHGNGPVNNEPLRSEENRSAAKPGVLNTKGHKPSESRILIDLTEDDPPKDLPKKTRRGIPSQSALSPLVHGNSVGPPPLQYGRDSSKSTARSLRRLLPWESSNDSVVHGSPSAPASNSSRRPASSGLREIRAKGPSNAGDARLEVLPDSTSKRPKQSHDYLETCQRVIQSNWGIKAHELLEPEYSHGQVWSNSMIELLAEIASKVSVGEARNRIKEAIDTRIGNDAGQEAGHPSRDRKIVKSDLEAVRGVVVTSSMSTASPFSPPHTNAAMEKQDEGTAAQWWEDDNSPFKSFARAYASIRPGKGNSFATTGPAESRDSQEKDEATRGGVQMKKINIMRWTL